MTLFQIKNSWGLPESSLPLGWDKTETNIPWRSRIHNKSDEIDTLDKSKAIVRREQGLLSLILHSFSLMSASKILTWLLTCGMRKRSCDKIQKSTADDREESSKNTQHVTYLMNRSRNSQILNFWKFIFWLSKSCFNFCKKFQSCKCRRWKVKKKWFFFQDNANGLFAEDFNYLFKKSQNDWSEVIWSTCIYVQKCMLVDKPQRCVLSD